MAGSGDTPQKAASRVASPRLLPIGGGGGTPVGVRAAPRQRPPLKIAPGRRGRRLTAPPPHFLLPQNPTCSFLSPTAPLSLYKSTTHPDGQSTLVESKSGLDSLAPPPAAWSFSPAPLALRLDFADPPCPSVPWPWQREPPPCCLHSSSHARPIRCFRSGLPQTCCCSPARFFP
ncbi:unnamed protein product [Urochloa humidicola]